MTVIVAARHGGKAWMGGDSASITAGTYDLTIRGTPKVFKVVNEHPVLIGTTGSARWGTVLRHAFVPPALDESFAWQTAEAMRALAKEYGVLSANEPQTVDGLVLVATPNQIFMVTSDFAAVQVADPYMAVGSGDLIALGSMAAGWEWTDSDAVLSPASIHQIALNAMRHAERFCIGVRGPFTLIGTHDESSSS